jgi:hypothetical protein
MTNPLLIERGRGFVICHFGKRGMTRLAPFSFKDDRNEKSKEK